jgi:hypothetical protein
MLTMATWALSGRCQHLSKAKKKDMKRAADSVTSGPTTPGQFEAQRPALLRVAAGATSLFDPERAGAPLKQSAGTCSGTGEGIVEGEGASGDLIFTTAAGFIILLVQSALAFHKYRFNNGLVLGTTLAAVDLYADKARRKGLQPSRVTLFLIANGAATLTFVCQQAAGLVATGLPHSITHS